MRQLLLVPILLVAVSCGHQFNNSQALKSAFESDKGQKMDTLIAVHEDCSNCEDLIPIQGSLSIPPNLSPTAGQESSGAFKICGNFPVDLLTSASTKNNPNTSFRIVGKIIKTTTGNGNKQVPLFYVDNWQQFYFSKAEWAQKGDAVAYPNRAKIMEELLDNVRFDGQPVSAITQILGEPNLRESNKIGYSIEEKRGPGTELNYSRFLEIIYNKDSIVIAKSVKEWRKAQP